jgi:sugar phosphate isomerase/epimerase
MKFALFTGSTPEWTTAEVARKAADQGWRGLEWRVVDQKPSDVPGFWAGSLSTFPLTGIEELVPEIVDTTNGAGLDFAGVAAYVPIGDRRDVERVLAVTAALGAGRVRLTMPKTEAGTDYAELFAQARADAEFASERAADLGVQVVIQLHHGTITATASAARRLLDGLDPAAIGVIHDLGNTTVEGREGLQTPAPGLQILGEHLAHVHIKNVAWRPGESREDGTVDWEWSWAPLRTGMADVPGYFRALHSVGYDGWVTLEDFTTELPLEERIADDLAYLTASATAAGYEVK